MQTVRRPHGFHHKPYGFLKLDIKLFSQTAMPQRRNPTPRSPYGGLAMAVRWHTFFTLSWVPINSHDGLTASLRRPHGALTAAVRQTCGSCNNREGAVQSPYGRLPVSMPSPYGFWFHESYDHRNICDRNYRSPQDLTIFWKSRFTNHRPQSSTTTVRRQHDMWPRHETAPIGSTGQSQADVWGMKVVRWLGQLSLNLSHLTQLSNMVH